MKNIIATATLLLIATSASAADAVSTVAEAPIAAESTERGFEWTGGYAGVTGGYGWLDGRFETAGLNPLDGNFDGGSLGAFAGFNTQFDNNFVIGIEGDLEHNWNEENLATLLGTFTGKADWQGSIRGRLGYSFGRALVYASAGWAAAHVDAELQGIASTRETYNGYTVGAGVDYAVTDRIFGRLDYRYNDFRSKDLDFAGTTVESDLSQHTVKLGVGVKF
ncbi:MAG: porin family protein [Rhizobium sp.]|nr:porin family protein [Rhizobium sp.]